MKASRGILRYVFLAASVSMLSTAALAQGVPTAITYQGKLTDTAGNPVPDGSYNMQFALYTTETGGSPAWTSATMSVPCAGGVFSARIEVSKAGNVPLGNVWIEPTVQSTALPRVKLASGPYALYAQELVLPFAGSASTADEVLKITNSGAGIAGLFNNSASGNANPALVARTSGTGNALHALSFSGTTGCAGYFQIMNSANTSSALLGLTGGGGSAVYGQNTGTGRAGSFYIANPSNTSPALYVSTDGTGSAVRGYSTGSTGSSAGSFEISNAGNASSALTSTTSGTGRAGSFTISNTASSADAVYASTSGSGSAVHAVASNTQATPGTFEITNASNPSNTVHATTSGTGGALYGYTTGTGNAAYLRIANTSSTSPALAVETNGGGHAGRFERTTSGTNAALYAKSNAVGPAVQGLQQGLGHGSVFRIENVGSGSAAVRGETTSGSGYGVYGVNEPSGTYGLLGSASYGVYGFTSAASGRAVQGSASASTGIGVYGYASGTTGTALWAYATGSSGTGIYSNASGTDGIGIRARGGSAGLAAMFEGNVRLLDRDTYLPVMELGKGLDYAEGFDVSDADKAMPGTVLVIDPDNPGKLTVSTKPYDRRVAGIVAGANGVSSGVRLGVDQFDCDVALAGRVYCNVDATQAAIEPGDLLTTSGTPGYAMKVTRQQSAHGAILGKAMQPLKKGAKGQILVLVTLQ